eukprot:7811653-Pyramimonas_sp.AAC.1
MADLSCAVAFARAANIGGGARRRRRPSPLTGALRHGSSRVDLSARAVVDRCGGAALAPSIAATSDRGGDGDGQRPAS